MKYLEMCIKESARIYPAVPIYSRDLDTPLMVNGVCIPANTSCTINVFDLHRDEQNFPVPEKFIPERFEPNSPIHHKPYAYLPFSAGPRNCIGQKFAMLEMKIILASVFRRFHLTAISHRDKMNIQASLVIKVVNPIEIKFEARNSIQCKSPISAESENPTQLLPA